MRTFTISMNTAHHATTYFPSLSYITCTNTTQHSNYHTHGIPRPPYSLRTSDVGAPHITPHHTTPHHLCIQASAIPTTNSLEVHYRNHIKDINSLSLEHSSRIKSSVTVFILLYVRQVSIRSVLYNLHLFAFLLHVVSSYTK